MKDYDLNESELVLSEIRKEVRDAIMHADEMDESEQLDLLITLVGELAEINVGMFRKLEELDEQVHTDSDGRLRVEDLPERKEVGRRGRDTRDHPIL